MKGISLGVFVPTNDSKLHAATVMSLLSLVQELSDRKTKCRVEILTGDSVIQRVRNAAVAKFLANRSLTHLLFVDSDIGFSSDTVVRMLKFNEPVVCAAYPLKKYRTEKPRGLVPRDLDQLQRASLDYTVIFEDPGVLEGKSKPDISRGFAKVERAGTGMLMIRREVFQRIAARYPELRYRPDSRYTEPEVVQNFFGFFDPYVNDARMFVAEDFAFCDRWVKGCGGTIWCDVEAKLTHHGDAEFRGNLLDTITIRKRAARTGDM